MLDTIIKMFSVDGTALGVVAQIVGFAGAFTYFLVFQMKKRSSILAINVLAGMIFVVHFSMIGALTGAAMNVVCALRCIVYYYSDKAWAKSKAWLAIFVGISIVLGVFTWGDIYSIFPLMAMVITSISFWLKKERNIRLLTLPTQPFWMIYNIHNNSISGLLTDVVIFSSILIAIIRYDIIKSKKPKLEKQNEA
ncbi:MAG TPA: YgjV family protein [Oscillospiraceae bacterium]|nr:YgjV family protein [Oscillospiraceae bacterium]